MMESNLPQGWVECSIGEILLSKKGKKPESTIDEPREGYIPYILIDEMEGKSIRGYTNDPKVSAVDENHVLLVWDGSIGKCGSGLKGAIGSTLVGLCPLDNIPPKFIEYTIKQQNNFIKETSTGTGLQHINKDFFEICKIPLPPLAEQHRIVAKLDALMQKVENNKKRLDKIPALLKRFRQSVLAAAVSGGLVESKSEWKEVELNYLLGKKGLFDGPFGSNLKTIDYVEKGVRVIRLENIEHLLFIRKKESFITEEKYRSLTKHTVGVGDIIFSSFIADEIRACILPILNTKAIAKADCFCIRPNEKLIDRKFLLFSLVSRKSYDQLVLNIHGATRPRINTTQLKRLILSMPKLSDQEEIVRCVEQLFSFAEKVEARYIKAKAMLNELPQSILAKAFRGELVPQDPEDEPAGKLLERIKGDRERRLKLKR
jgi:type I restriction enzyme S subunit